MVTLIFTSFGERIAIQPMSAFTVVSITSYRDGLGGQTTTVSLIKLNNIANNRVDSDKHSQSSRI